MTTRNRGRKKTSLRDLSRLPPTREEKDELVKRLSKKQEPIVTAILGQALLEIELDGLLRSHFVRRDDVTWSMLTDDRGPLATFHSKIVAAHAFGVCDDVIRDGLNTVRQIRNAFAHDKKQLQFSHELIVKKLATISLPAEKPKWLRNSLSAVKETAADSPKEAQSAYIMLCITLETALLKKLRVRLKAKNLRLSKRYRKGLVQALMGSQPKPPTNRLLSYLQSHNVDPSLLTLEPYPKKAGR